MRVLETVAGPESRDRRSGLVEAVEVESDELELMVDTLLSIFSSTWGRSAAEMEFSRLA